MKPLVEGLRQRYADTIDFRLYNVENDQEGIALAETIGVTYVPTFAFVGSDGVVRSQVVGEQTSESLASAIQALR